jgi:uncharacterized protein (TIGR02147 family)
MSMANEDYRAILKGEFEQRCNRNPRYSLRAFAKALGISPARVSEIFSGKQGLSAKSAAAIGKRLGWGEVESQMFCDLVEAKHSKSKIKRRLAEIRIAQNPARQLPTLQMDAFQVISDWHHFAILELTLIEGFKSDPAWIARRLGLQPNAAEMALERLLRLDLLTRDADGKLSAKDDFTASPDGIPSAALKKFHQQVIEKAVSALYTQPVEDRDVTNMMFAFDRSKMKEAKALIREFRRGFNQKLGPSPKNDSVYCLAIQFFQLDQNQTEEKKV